MRELLYFFVALIIVITIFVFYSYISNQIISFMTTTEPNIITLEKPNEEIENIESTPSAILDFCKRFVIYQLQPIIHLLYQ
jgi:hypothetical protein